MTDPQQIAAGVLGPVDWQTEVSGYCRCPGEKAHTHPTNKKNCRVSIDGAPTIHCFHSSCREAVAATNYLLRRALGAAEWSLKMPGGKVLKSGDLMGSGGAVVSRGAIVERARAVGVGSGDALVLASMGAMAERFSGEMFKMFHWPFAQILEDSPLHVCDRDADQQFRTWLKLWPADSTVWVGDVYDSGKPEHRTHFRSVAEWQKIGPVMGNYTCGASFKAGSWQRSNANVGPSRFLVVESDTLSKDSVGAVFAYLNRRLGFGLHAIIDTAGKSLHGWFDAPCEPRLAAMLKATLTAFGCDPKMFTFSQPVRVPGAMRDGKLQRIVWLRT